MGYSGTCRAKERIFFDGRFIGAGQVFEVENVWIHPETPFEPVRVIGYDRQRNPAGHEVVKPMCERLARNLEELRELNRRGVDAAPGVAANRRCRLKQLEAENSPAPLRRGQHAPKRLTGCNTKAL
jgi:hypothetical protein